MPSLFHHFWCHPAWRTHEGLPLLAFLQRSRNTEVTYEDVAFHVQQNVACLNVSVYHLILMEVLQPKEGFSHYGSYHCFTFNTLREIKAHYIKTRACT